MNRNDNEFEPGTTSSGETKAGLAWRERFVWIGVMLFFVLMLALYIFRGAGLEQDVQNIGRELLETQSRLLQVTRGDVQRPVTLGLTREQIVGLQRRGVANPEATLFDALASADASAGIEPLAAGDIELQREDFHVLNQRWIVAGFRSADAGEGAQSSGRLLLSYRLETREPVFELLDVIETR